MTQISPRLLNLAAGLEGCEGPINLSRADADVLGIPCDGRSAIVPAPQIVAAIQRLQAPPVAVIPDSVPDPTPAYEPAAAEAAPEPEAKPRRK